jgi:diguanylate cyclase (GGDEF)-like protein
VNSSWRRCGWCAATRSATSRPGLQPIAGQAARHTRPNWRRLAHHDTLTGLPNRKLLDDRLQQALVRAKRQANQVAVLYLDLDGFKRLNDTFGHEAGDKALRETPAGCMSLVRHTDTVARIGGDEFVLIAANFAEPAEHAVPRRWPSNASMRWHCRCNCGMPTWPWACRSASCLRHGGATPQDLLAAADKAMYQAKQNGRGGYAMTPAPTLATEPA